MAIFDYERERVGVGVLCQNIYLEAKVEVIEGSLGGSFVLWFEKSD